LITGLKDRFHTGDLSGWSYINLRNTLGTIAIIQQKVLISNVNFAKLKTELRKITDEVYDSILFWEIPAFITYMVADAADMWACCTVTVIIPGLLSHFFKYSVWIFIDSNALFVKRPIPVFRIF
jgi:hypothetical protein